MPSSTIETTHAITPIEMSMPTAQNAETFASQFHHKQRTVTTYAVKRDSRLPAEIEEIVFSHLDRNTMATCTSVCSRWYTRLTPRVYAQVDWMHARRLIQTVACIESAIAWRVTHSHAIHRRQLQSLNVWRLADTPVPVVYIRRLVGWFEPDAVVMNDAQKALVTLCDLIVALNLRRRDVSVSHPHIGALSTISNSSDHRVTCVHHATAIEPQQQHHISDAPMHHDWIHVRGIDTIHIDTNFVSDALLLRIIFSNADTVTSMRVSGITPALFTAIAHAAPKLTSLEVSSEREEVKLVSVPFHLTALSAASGMLHQSDVSGLGNDRQFASVPLLPTDVAGSVGSGDVDTESVSAFAPAAEPSHVVGPSTASGASTTVLSDAPTAAIASTLADSGPLPSLVTGTAHVPHAGDASSGATISASQPHQRMLSSALCFPSLEMLSISATSERPRYSLLTIDSATIMPSLRRLSLYYVHLTDQTLQILLMRNRKTLTSLNLSYVTGLSDTVLGSLPQLCPHLKDLELTYTNISDAGMHLLAHQTQNIKRLVLVGNYKLTDDGVVAVSQCWKSALLEIDLGGSMPGVTDTSVLSLINACSRLGSIRLRHLDRVTSTVMHQLPVSACAKSLRYLDVRWCASIAVEHVKSLVRDSRLPLLMSCRVVQHESHRDDDLVSGFGHGFSNQQSIVVSR